MAKIHTVEDPSNQNSNETPEKSPDSLNLTCHPLIQQLQLGLLQFRFIWDTKGSTSWEKDEVG